MDRNYPPQRIQVRPGLTARPQTLYHDFKLSPSRYGLEIRLSQRRIRSRLIPAMPSDTALERSSEEEQLWTVLAFVMAIFVGVIVVVTQSVAFSVIVAFLLPVAMWLVTTAGQVKESREVTLRMVNAPNGQTFLSASSSVQPTRSAQYKHLNKSISATENSSVKNKLHFNHFPIHLVSANTTFMGGQVCLTLYNTAQHRREEICIKGSRYEVRWLHARIAKWGRGNAAPAQPPLPAQAMAQPFSKNSSESSSESSSENSSENSSEQPML
jgi:hypothetical protein